MAGRCSHAAWCTATGDEHRGVAGLRPRGAGADGARLLASSRRRAGDRLVDGASAGRDADPGADALRRSSSLRRAPRAGRCLPVDRRSAPPLRGGHPPGSGVGAVIRELAALADAMRPELLGWALATMRVL